MRQRTIIGKRAMNGAGQIIAIVHRNTFSFHFSIPCFNARFVEITNNRNNRSLKSTTESYWTLNRSCKRLSEVRKRLFDSCHQKVTSAQEHIIGIVIRSPAKLSAGARAEENPRQLVYKSVRPMSSGGARARARINSSPARRRGSEAWLIKGARARAWPAGSSGAHGEARGSSRFPEINGAL